MRVRGLFIASLDCRKDTLMHKMDALKYCTSTQKLYQKVEFSLLLNEKNVIFVQIKCN
jgi:hypothetical protein